MKRFLLILSLSFYAHLLIAQTSLMGIVSTEENKEAVADADIRIYKNEIYITKTKTDLNGYYALTLDPGNYDLEITSIGFSHSTIQDVLIIDGKINPLNILTDEFQSCFGRISCFSSTRYTYRVPLIDLDNTSSTGIPKDSEAIQQQASKNIHQISILTAGVSFQY